MWVRLVFRNIASSSSCGLRLMALYAVPKIIHVHFECLELTFLRIRPCFEQCEPFIDCYTPLS